MKNEEILKKLRAAGDYVSGQELCAYYGVSRTAVWKAIRQLEKDGYVIEAQNNRGYRLVESEETDIYNGMEIESCLDTEWVGRKLVFHRETGSTNIDAKLLAEQGEEEGAVVVADMQTAGRGRRGRGWVSPAGKDIYMTIMLRPQCRVRKRRRRSRLSWRLLFLRQSGRWCHSRAASSGKMTLLSMAKRCAAS